MKKFLILFILILSINTHAQDNYTDYEYLGYTFEQKENDELYKYEQITLNRFYKTYETDIEYIERGTKPLKKIDENDYKLEQIISENKPETYSYNQHITIKGQDNYICNKLIIKLLQSYENLKIYEIEIFNKDQKMTTTSNDVKEMIDGNLETYQEITTDSFTINFSSLAYVDNLTVKIYFDNEEPITLNYTVHNTSGMLKISKDITLDNKAEINIINSLKYDKYDPFIELNKFTYEDIKYYYDYKKNIINTTHY